MAVDQREDQTRSDSASTINGTTTITDNTSQALKLHEDVIHERFLRRAEANVSTRRSAIEQSLSQYKESSWLDSLSGTRDAIKQDIENERRLLQKEEAKVQEIKSALQRAQEFRAEAELHRNRGESIKADQAIHNAQQILSKVNRNVDLKEYRETLGTINTGLERSADKLQSAMTVTKVVRDGAVVTAATVATGGVFAGAAAGTSLVVVGAQAVAVGTATGTAVGLASNTSGAVVEGVIGDRSAGELAKDVLRQTGKDAVSSFVASASTAATMGVSSGISGGTAKAVQSATSGLGATGQRVATSVVSGAVAGGVNGTFTVTAQTSARYVEARVEFNRLAGENKWSAAEREAHYHAFLEERGLTAEKILKSGAIQIAASAAGGAVGGGTAAVQKSMQSAASRLLVSGTAVAADGAIGVGAAAIEGDVSKERLATIFGATIAGHAVGYFANKAEPFNKPKLEKGLDLLAEKYGTRAAEDFRDEIGRAVCKEQGLEPTAANIKAARELRLTRAGEEGALHCLNSLGEQVEKNGVAALTKENVEKTCEREMAKFTEQFCREYKLDKISERHTTDMLHDVTRLSNKKLAAEFEAMGIAHADALQTAKAVKYAVRSGEFDQAIKAKLENKITGLVTQDLQQGMEQSFKQTFRAGLAGELKAPQAQRLQDAMKAHKIKLSDEEISDLTEAGWTGAKRGIEQGVRKVVREGIDSAFENFRKRRESAKSDSPKQEATEEKTRTTVTEEHRIAKNDTDQQFEQGRPELQGQQQFQKTEEVSINGVRFERVLVREKNGEWVEVGMHQMA